MQFSSSLSFLFVAVSAVSAFVISSNTAATRPSTQLYDGDGTGGWGIGGSRELTPEEFTKGDRRYFDGYQMREQGDFRAQIAQEQTDLLKSEMDELLGVARIAGISIKDPSERLNKFSLPDDDDDDDLDLSV